MLTFKTRRRTVNHAQIVARMTAIETSIAALSDDDLLDLADIFGSDTPTPLKAMAGNGLARRDLSA